MTTPQPLIERSVRSTNRVAWVDYAKGIGIFLVVLGHTLRGLATRHMISLEGWFGLVDRWIYGFHMPLFFFLSGLFIYRTARKPFAGFIKHQFNIIVYPYFLWSILQSLLRSLTYKDPGFGETIANLWRIIYQPHMQFWFLYVLFVMSTLYALATKLRVPPFWFLSASLLLYILYALGVSFGPWSIPYQLGRFLIYFALGAVMGESGHLLSEIKVSSPLLLAMTALGWLGVGLAASFRLTEIGAVAPLIALFGIISTASLSFLLAQRSLIRFAENWGRLSLQIYVAHTIATAILRAILQSIFHITNPGVHIILGTAVGIYVPIGLVWLGKKFKFPYLFKLRAD